MNQKITIVFPCAGRAERFGHVFKPFLKIGDITFIEKAYEPFQKWEHMIEGLHFIVTREQEHTHKVSKKLMSLFSGKTITVSVLDKETPGPLQTFSEGYVHSARAEAPFIVCDCDHSINVDNLFAKIVQKPTAEIIIPTWNITEAIQHNWSKILLQNNEITKFVNKEAVDFETHTVKGIIGCIYFNSLKLFSDIRGNYYNFYEIIADHFKGGKTIELSDASNAYFFGDPAMLSDCIEKRRNECSIFCDIDGVLLKHNNHSTNNVEDNKALDGFTKLREMKKQNHRIILTTARNAKYRTQLEELLRQKEIYYDDLIMSLPSGPRLLINDRKPSKPFTAQANTHEVERDTGLSRLCVNNIIDNNKTEIIEDLSANSFAKTYLIQHKDKRCVRKHLFKSVGDKHYHVLKRQKADLERFNFLAKDLCPRVLGEGDTELDYYYDMEFLPDYRMLSEADSYMVIYRGLKNTLKIMNQAIYSLSQPVDGKKWMEEFLNQKINPKFDDFSLLNDEFRVIIESDEFLINKQKYVGLRKLFEKLPLESLSPKNVSVVHGDLTLENIMYKPDTLDVKLIDMDGSRLFDAKELDLGKLSQSIFSRYDKWKNLEGTNLVKHFDLQSKHFKANDSYFDNRELVMPSNLIELWQPILNESPSMVYKKACFYMSTYFIRFVPFRMQLGKEHGIFALLMATVWLNKLLGE
jgi:GTP:adenosylcobinamide-phosphate guanylyltransferase